ncbi:MAG: hypothetical protein ACI89E_000793 [Planctomycetota bacterium]
MLATSWKESRVKYIGSISLFSKICRSASGIYENSFEGLGADRFLPSPARRVGVPVGETM